MGNFEKLIVLTVLFLAAIILGVSLHDDGTLPSDDPLNGAGTSEEVAVLDREMPAVTQPETTNNRGTMASIVEPEVKKPEAKKPAAQPKAPVVKPKPVAKEASAPKKSLFLTTAGLAKPAFGDEYLIYTWREGDSLAAVAKRYYGDRKLRKLIDICNEGAMYRPGDKINMPIQNSAAEAGTRPAYDPAPAHVAPQEVPAKDALTYTVKDGDSLWGIAKEAYGKGTKWEQIFKANRDKLDDPGDIAPGMVILIP